MREREDLKVLQALPLKYKEMLTEQRLREMFDYTGGPQGFYVSFSGGKDSEVLCHIVAKYMHKHAYKKVDRKDYETDDDFEFATRLNALNILYVNTGLEYSSIRNFIRPFLDYISDHYQIPVKLHERYPEISFKEVIAKAGYPLIGKEIAQSISEATIGIKNGKYQRSVKKVKGELLDDDGKKSRYNCDKYSFLLDAPFKVSSQCCHHIKKAPILAFEKETGLFPVIGTMAEESELRTTSWLRHGCNAFNGTDRPHSAPLSIWTEQDILHYIKNNDLPLAEPYGEIRIKADPKKGFYYGQNSILEPTVENLKDIPYETSLQKRTGCTFCGFGVMYDPERFLRMQRLEPKKADFVLRGGKFDENGMWGPSDDGLGYWFVLDYLTHKGNIPIFYKDNNYRQSWAMEYIAA